MKSIRFVSAAVAASMVAPVAFAATVFEQNGALERGEFIYTELDKDQDTSVDDVSDDLVVFDRQQRNTMPPVLADLTNVTYTPQEDSWLVTFTIADPLPEDPGLAVNFDVFIDADGSDENNAPNGVYRTDSDTIFMILHGTRTKWHSKWWKFNPPTNRWIEQPNKPEYSIGDGEYTLTIPYEAVPRESGMQMRGFSLTSDEGITAIDIAPGDGLPALAAPPPPPPPTPPAVDPAPSPSQTSGGGHVFFFIVVGVLLAGAVYFWKKK